MSEEKEKPKRCAKCRKKFTPTPERKMTCKTCYGQNSNIPPLAEEPNLPGIKKQPTDDVFFRIHSSPTNIR
ncbi:MAG: hypothetical protein NTX00_02160 [Candidatus Parcubacteria bacterium]|nr:hypothetical protein [Candidatus Parcubacteria bacterium]